MLRVLKRRSKDSLFNNGMKDNETDISPKKNVIGGIHFNLGT